MPRLELAVINLHIVLEASCFIRSKVKTQPINLKIGHMFLTSPFWGYFVTFGLPLTWPNPFFLKYLKCVASPVPKLQQGPKI